MKNTKSNILKTRLFINEGNVIKLLNKTKTGYEGYDIFTEEYTKLPRKNTIELPVIILNILKSKELRIKLASVICRTRREASQVIGLSERSTYRALKKYDMPPKRKLKTNKHQKIKL